jgi:hypothetical protein
MYVDIYIGTHIYKYSYMYTHMQIPPPDYVMIIAMMMMMFTSRDYNEYVTKYNLYTINADQPKRHK